jgi:Flp pilus assembly pilin Flp
MGARVMHRFLSLVSRFGRDERGVFAVLFGLMAIVLIALGGAVVDYVSLEQARNRGQLALDAAALALQPEIFDDTLTTEDIRIRARDLVVNRIGDDRITITVGTPVINTDLGSLFFTADMTVPTIFVSLVGVQSLPARIQSEVRRGSLDVEVAVAVDITGSMNDRVPTGNGWQTEAKIEALERALGELIDVVVKDEQEPSYSKMAIVPYSMGVNVGGYAATIRGAVTAPTAITNVSWSTGSAKTITGATKQNPVVITSNNHGFANGDRVYINGVSGMTQINNAIFTVANANTNTFRLQGVNGTSYSTHSGSTGRATKCVVSTCELVVTSAGHGLSTGDNAFISGVVGTTSGSMKTYSPPGWPVPGYARYDNSPTFDNANYNWVNNNTNGISDYRFLVWKIGTVLSTSSFVLPGTSRVNKDFGTYASGGTVACVTAGCQYYLFQNRYSNSESWRRHPISTCATERTANGLNDASPATTLLGRNYPTPANPCPSVTILPLTDNKAVLHDLADDLPAAGSTAGHLGIGWAWYLVSPRFNGPWPAASQPAPADEPNVLRAVVLMTDGAFNTSYCNGVISQISTSGSGDENSKINCNPANGDSYTQAEALCDAMKAADPSVRVYTVAFDVGDIQGAQDVMANCATDSSHAFEATTGGDLSAVFAQIGENLAYLRVTQ